MGSMLINQRAAQSGFSKILGSEETQFIFLSDNTKGICGRSVYINANLSHEFSKRLTKDTAHRIFPKLEQLRATAGGLQAYSSFESSFEHFTTIENVQIGYKIFQNISGSSSKKPGVYITSIDFSKLDGKQPGFYKVVSDGDNWNLKSRDSKERIESRFAAINGLAKDLEAAATKIMPTMLEKTYSDFNNQDFNLFYNPQPLYSRGVKWKTPDQKQQSKQFAANILSEAMLRAQHRGKEVSWVVHGNGAQVFQNAMQRLQGKKLDKHKVMFLGPAVGDMEKILPMMRQSEMQLHTDVMKTQKDDWVGWKNKTNKNIAQEVAKFGENFSDAAASIKYDSKLAFDTLYKIKTNSAFNVGLGLGALAIAPVFPEIAMGAAALGSAKLAWGASTFVRSAENMRNIAANTVSDSALNPHLNPYKTPGQMNQSIENASGESTAKSFVTIVRAMIGK